MALACAAWTALAMAFVAPTAKGWRALGVVALDLSTRSLPGNFALLSASTHVANLLGAPPPQSIVAASALIAQPTSVVVLVAYTVLAVGLAGVRHRAARAR
jgi:hypothetical protein